MNIQGTEAGSVTEGLPETRSLLKRLAMAHGAETKIGRACHNLLEMTENYSKSDDLGQKRQLAANIQREMTRLEDLKKGAH